jgi:hypothetical protein
MLNVKIMDVVGERFIFYEWKDAGYTRKKKAFKTFLHLRAPNDLNLSLS